MKQNISPKLSIFASAFIASLTGCFAQTASKNYKTIYRHKLVVNNEGSVSRLSKESGQKAISNYDRHIRTDLVLLVAGLPLWYNLVTFISYFDFGSLKLAKEKDENILKKAQYHYNN